MEPSVIPHIASCEDVKDIKDARPTLPPRVKSSSLSKPIAIPATNSLLGSPFLRAYPLELENFGITREIFLQFLDRLNQVAVLSPPLLMVSLGCTVAGFVPDPTVQIVSMSVDAVTEITQYAMSKGRTESLLKQANRDIFGPHGMKARVAKLDVVAHLAGMPVLDDKGKVLKDASILEQIDGGELQDMAAQARRLKALEPWLSPLDIEELPEMEKQENAMRKMHTNFSEWQRKKGEEKIVKNRKKAYNDMTEGKEKAMKRWEEEIEDIAKAEAKMRAKRGELSEVEAAKFDIARQTAAEKYKDALEGNDKKYRKGDKEEKGIRKIYFLLLSNVDELDVVGEQEAEKDLERLPSETDKKA